MNMQLRGWGAVSAPEKEGRARSWSPCELSVNKGWRDRRANSRQVTSHCLIGQVVVHKTHLLSQWATSKVRQHCKIEKQSANHHSMLTSGGRLTDHWPCPRERGQGKETSPQRKPNSKAGWMVGYRADLLNLRISHTSLREELTK
jgi:hypothetical protein